MEIVTVDEKDQKLIANLTSVHYVVKKGKPCNSLDATIVDVVVKRGVMYLIIPVFYAADAIVVDEKATSDRVDVTYRLRVVDVVIEKMA